MLLTVCESGERVPPPHSRPAAPTLRVPFHGCSPPAYPTSFPPPPPLSLPPLFLLLSFFFFFPFYFTHFLPLLFLES